MDQYLNSYSGTSRYRVLFHRTPIDSKDNFLFVRIKIAEFDTFSADIRVFIYQGTPIKLKLNQL